jgi:hypothetical protein
VVEIRFSDTNTGTGAGDSGIHVGVPSVIKNNAPAAAATVTAAEEPNYSTTLNEKAPGADNSNSQQPSPLSIKEFVQEAINESVHLAPL